MDGKLIARLAAVVTIAVAVTAAAIDLARDGKSTGPQSPPPTTIDTPRTDPRRETLGRCQQMGEAATRDPECLAAWDDNRRRFLSPTKRN